MRQFTLAFISLLFSLALFAQKCPPRGKAKAVAPSGLIMRAQPGLQGEILTSIPYNQSLAVCLDTTYGKLTVENIRGTWRYAEYKNFRGYLFDGFLEVTDLGAKPTKLLDSVEAVRAERSEVVQELAPEAVEVKGEEAVAKNTRTHHHLPGTQFQFLTEAYNYCGPVRQLDAGLLWYGVYLNEEGKHYRIEPVKLSISLSTERLSDALEFDILTDRQERSVFLFGSNRMAGVEQMHISQRESELKSRQYRVFPGQTLVLNQSPRVSVSAVGSVLEAGDCPQLKDYRMELKLETEGQTLRQNLSALLAEQGRCGLPDIYWYGDLSGDGIPELIIVTKTDEGNHFYFFSSQGTSDQEILQLQSKFSQTDCNEE